MINDSKCPIVYFLGFVLRNRIISPAWRKNFKKNCLGHKKPTNECPPPPPPLVKFLYYHCHNSSQRILALQTKKNFATAVKNSRWSEYWQLPINFFLFIFFYSSVSGRKEKKKNIFHRGGKIIEFTILKYLHYLARVQSAGSIMGWNKDEGKI